jgi:hypothetical protein
MPADPIMRPDAQDGGKPESLTGSRLCWYKENNYKEPCKRSGSAGQPDRLVRRRLGGSAAHRVAHILSDVEGSMCAYSHAPWRLIVPSDPSVFSVTPLSGNAGCDQEVVRTLCSDRRIFRPPKRARA